MRGWGENGRLTAQSPGARRRNAKVGRYLICNRVSATSPQLTSSTVTPIQVEGACSEAPGKEERDREAGRPAMKLQQQSKQACWEGDGGKRSDSCYVLKMGATAFGDRSDTRTQRMRKRGGGLHSLGLHLRWSTITCNGEDHRKATRDFPRDEEQGHLGLREQPRKGVNTQGCPV